MLALLFKASISSDGIVGIQFDSKFQVWRSGLGWIAMAEFWNRIDALGTFLVGGSDRFGGEQRRTGGAVGL